MVFAIHWHESAMDLHVFPILTPPASSLSITSYFKGKPSDCIRPGSISTPRLTSPLLVAWLPGTLQDPCLISSLPTLKKNPKPQKTFAYSFIFLTMKDNHVIDKSRYWVGQRICSCFSMLSSGRIRVNFLANPILGHEATWVSITLAWWPCDVRQTSYAPNASMLSSIKIGVIIVYTVKYHCED